MKKNRWEKRDRIVTVLERHISGNNDGESANDYRGKLEAIAEDIVSAFERMGNE